MKDAVVVKQAYWRYCVEDSEFQIVTNANAPRLTDFLHQYLS